MTFTTLFDFNGFKIGMVLEDIIERPEFIDQSNSCVGHIRVVEVNATKTDDDWHFVGYFNNESEQKMMVRKALKVVMILLE